MTEPETTRDRLADVFGQILEADEADRPALLDMLCRDDADLRAEVVSLLACHGSAGDFLSRLDVERAADLLDAEGASSMPERAGPYRLVAELGRGGMGTVYLGERVEGGFEQRVAVKVLKRGMDTEAIVERFYTERRILAGLDHPSIARLFDGGIVEDGRPWFAMEPVDGESLYAWCDRRKATIDERLRLFEEICRAVQHAHARLVVHRDLKPANILVTENGRPKLLDFGIAKLLDESSSGLAAATRAGRRLMTREYAAPEQVRGEPATVATDVYALGVLLYELLAGRHPYAEDAATPTDLEAAVCTTLPEPPSTAVRGERAVTDAAARDSSPDRLRRRLRGDLDRIVLKTLAKEPEARYVSVEALAQDLESYRKGLPVKARPESIGYRVRRFVGRHRVGVATTVAAALALAAGLVVALWQRDVAAHERDRARQEAERARQVQSFLTGLFESSDPAESKGEDTTARELLERGVERIDDELAGQPLAQVELLDVLGRVYMELGSYDTAVELLERGAELARGGPAGDPLRRARLLAGLGQALSETGDFTRAQEVLLESVALRRRHTGEASVETGESLTLLGVAHHLDEEHAEAERYYDRAAAIFREHLPEDDDWRLELRHDRGVLATDVGRLEEGVRLHARNLELRLARDGEDHPGTVAILNSLSSSLRAAGRLEEALESLERGLTIAERIHDENHPRVANLVNSIGVLQRQLGNLAEAEARFARVLEIDRATLGADHPFVAVSLDNLAATVAEQGRVAEARELLERSAAVYRATDSTGSPRYAYNLQFRARTEEIAGDLRAAEAYAEQCVRIRERALGAEHFETARGEVVRARIIHRLGRLDEAGTTYRRAIGHQEAAFDGPHPDLAESLVGYGSLLLDLDRPRDAESVLRRAAEMRETFLPPDNWLLAQARGLVGASLCARGEAGKGGADVTTAVEALRRTLGAGHPDTDSLVRLGSVCARPNSS